MSLNKSASPPAPPLTAQRAERAGKHSDKQKYCLGREFSRELVHRCGDSKHLIQTLSD